jgi:hypothetical protein
MLSISDDSLPSYVKKLPRHVINKWVNLFNEVLVKDGEEIAFMVANQWLKDNITNDDLFSYEGDGKVSYGFNAELIDTEDVSEDVITVDMVESTVGPESDVMKKALELLILKVDKLEKIITPKESSSEDIVLSFVKDGGLVKQADGNSYVDFILTDDGYDRKGLRIQPHVMNKWAEMINKGSLVIKGDINHGDWDMFMDKGVSKEKFIPLLKKFKKGFAKSIKAIVDNGKMWVRAMVAPGYEDIISKATGVSLEARLDIDDATNEAYDGDLGGFTFTVGIDPINPRSVIHKKK